MSPADWPVATPLPRRAVTAEEHARIVATENDPERRRYYQMLWETGGAQSDIAELTWDNVDRAKNVLVYHRKKTGEKCQMTIGPSLCELMSRLPQEGAFFPAQRLIEAKHRSTEFRRRCRVLKITGLSPHSYRYAWAERACSDTSRELFTGPTRAAPTLSVPHLRILRGVLLSCEKTH
jgi:integrase